MIGEHVGLIKAKTVSEAWEEAVFFVWFNGRQVPHYNWETTTTVYVEEPMAEPRLHKGDYFCWMTTEESKTLGYKNYLEYYIAEVCYGINDDKTDKLDYTYHDRITRYPWLKEEIDELAHVNPNLDQLSLTLHWLWKELLDGMENDKAYPSNRHQVITWAPEKDLGARNPPCLQRIWLKFVDGALEMHTDWRSRDCFHAWNLNALAMTEWQSRMAEKMKLKVGAYVDFSNSLHIYEKDEKEVVPFIETLSKRKPELRGKYDLEKLGLYRRR